MFCFLPLSMNTGLPVHVSSNFAVSIEGEVRLLRDRVQTCCEALRSLETSPHCVVMAHTNGCVYTLRYQMYVVGIRSG